MGDADLDAAQGAADAFAGWSGESFGSRLAARMLSWANRAQPRIEALEAKAPSTFQIGYSLPIAGTLTTASKPVPIFIPEPAPQTVTVLQVRCRIQGAANAAAVVQLTRNGSGVGPLMSASILAMTATVTQTLSDGDELGANIISVQNSPQNLSFTVFMKVTT